MTTFNDVSVMPPDKGFSRYHLRLCRELSMVLNEALRLGGAFRRETAPRGTSLPPPISKGNTAHLKLEIEL